MKAFAVLLFTILVSGTAFADLLPCEPDEIRLFNAEVARDRSGRCDSGLVVAISATETGCLVAAQWGDPVLELTGVQPGFYQLCGLESGPAFKASLIGAPVLQRDCTRVLQ